LSREAAGAAIRSLREARDWSLADFAAATGVSVMGLSYLERGVRKPHKGTVQKIESGLGLAPGTYSRLVLSQDANAEAAELLAAQGAVAARTRTSTIVVERHNDTSVLEGFAEAQLEALKAVIDRLPPPTSNVYETYIHNVIAQCVKAEMLAANSWRVAVNSGAPADGPLLGHIRALESTRVHLLSLLPDSLGARLDLACARSQLPETVIAALLGITLDQLWDIRNQGPIPAGALARVQAYVGATIASVGDPAAAPNHGTPDKALHRHGTSI
jgi:transcriptional regulator with XRE-family HTH domain